MIRYHSENCYLCVITVYREYGESRVRFFLDSLIFLKRGIIVEKNRWNKIEMVIFLDEF